MPDYVVQRLLAGLNQRGKPLMGSRVLLLGLAYKANTGDARESPAVDVANLLMRYGAVVHAVDPHVAEDQIPAGVRRVEMSDEQIGSSDAIVVLVDHSTFDLSRLGAAAYVLDTRHRCQGPNVEYL